MKTKFTPVGIALPTTSSWRNVMVLVNKSDPQGGQPVLVVEVAGWLPRNGYTEGDFVDIKDHNTKRHDVIAWAPIPHARDVALSVDGNQEQAEYMARRIRERAR